MAPTLVILAAGRSRRFGRLKQLEPVGPRDETLLDYTLADAARAGFDTAVLVTTPALGEELRDHVVAQPTRPAKITVTHQLLDDVPAGCRVPPDRAKPWGTGHAALAAAAVVEGPFALANADDYYGPDAWSPLAAFLRSADPAAATYVMAGFRLDATLSAHGGVNRGIATVDADGRVTDLVEITQLRRTVTGIDGMIPEGARASFAPDAATSMNLWGFTPRVFDDLRPGFRRFLKVAGTDADAEYALSTVVGDLVRAGRATLTCRSTPGPWFGLTHPADHDVVSRYFTGRRGHAVSS